MEGFSGFSSFRIGIWVISLFFWGLSGWLFAFFNSKGKPYRFTILAPLFMGFFQLLIYVLDSRKSNINGFNIKVIINLLLILIITILYFKLRDNERAN
ncbi:MAG TPA: hypothetical protein DDE71_06125 [Tenacibaculum sp.]|nr:hypothetical protein [Tenacibaculum sp.]